MFLDSEENNLSSISTITVQQIFFFVFAVFLIICSSTLLYASEKEAIEHWRKGKDLYSKDKFSDADGEFLKAVQFVNKDKKICFRVQVVKQSSRGRIIIKEKYWNNDCYNYDAKSRLKKLRQRFPPQILAVAKVMNLQERIYLNPGECVKLKIECHNIGVLSVCDLEGYCINNDERSVEISPRNFTLGNIKPGEVKNFTYELKVNRSILSSKAIPIKIGFREMFGFAPNDISMTIDVGK